MTHLVGSKLEGATLRLDGGTFEDCELVRCRFEYSGGPPPVFVRCKIEACGIAFDGGAAGMLATLATLHASGDWGRTFVDGVLRSVTGGELIQRAPASN